MPWCPNLGRGVDVTTCTKARTKTTQQERSPPMERPRRIPEQTRVHRPPEHSSELVRSRVSDLVHRDFESGVRGLVIFATFCSILIFATFCRIPEMTAKTVDHTTAARNTF